MPHENDQSKNEKEDNSSRTTYKNYVVVSPSQPNEKKQGLKL